MSAYAHGLDGFHKGDPCNQLLNMHVALGMTIPKRRRQRDKPGGQRTAKPSASCVRREESLTAQ